MPLFWFMNFANVINIIKDKTFCFDVQLRPNPRTWHTTRIHMARCNSAKLREICMFKFPPLLLEKRAIAGLLSQNLFCQLQARGKWLTILESLKKKKKKTNMANDRNYQPNKQGALISLKWYMFVVSICSSCINFSRWLAPLVFHLYLYLLWRGSCLRVTLVSISISTSFIVTAYSIPLGYMHKFYLFFSFD